MLHMLDMASLAAQQHPTLAPKRAQHTDLVGWAERPAEQAEGHELLQPLAVQYVGFAPRDILDVARVHQQNREAARLQQLEQGDPMALGQPLDAGRFHGDGVDPTGIEPVGDGVEVDREAGKLQAVHLIC